MRIFDAIRRITFVMAAVVTISAPAAAQRGCDGLGVRRIEQDRPRLSDRQRDCIYWAARGKSDWEISKILGISHDTAIQYMKEARGRYGVGNRTQLAIHALFDGALTFTDALRR